MPTVIRGVPEERDKECESTPICSGTLRYRTNCLGKLIIQTKVERFKVGKGWKHEWVDAKAHQVTMVNE